MLTFVAVLVGLALLDSMAIGTLFIPLWLLLAPGPFNAGRVATYLSGVIGFYFAVGVILLLGADVVIEAVREAFAAGGALDNPAANGVMLAIGLGLFALSFYKPKPKDGPSRMARWRERAMGVTSARALVGLAVIACAIEFWTMIPYLGAVALISSLENGWAVRLGWLAAYCVMMVSPAIVLAIARAVAGEKMQPGLDWFNGQMDRHGGNAMLWIVGVLGVVLAWFAASRLLGF